MRSTDRANGSHPPIFSTNPSLSTRSSSLQSPERFQTPRILGRGLTLPQDIQVAIIRAHLEEHVARAVPLIQHFLHEEGTLIEPEPHRPLIRLPARVTLHANLHQPPLCRLSNPRCID